LTAISPLAKNQIKSTNKTDRHDITEILLKMALNIVTLTNNDDFLFFIVGH
jgi:hypothetical protein